MLILHMHLMCVGRPSLPPPASLQCCPNCNGLRKASPMVALCLLPPLCRLNPALFHLPQGRHQVQHEERTVRNGDFIGLRVVGGGGYV